MRKIVRSLFVLAAVALIPACSDSTGPNRAVTGSYTLISVNGVLMPVVFSVDQFFTLRITAGNLTLTSDNKFTASATYEQTLAGGGAKTTDTETCTGTYSMSGNTITFTEANSNNSNCGGVYTGTWDGENSLTVEFDDGVQALFEK
jgi:hypothetical protein